MCACEWGLIILSGDYNIQSEQGLSVHVHRKTLLIVNKKSQFYVESLNSYLNCNPYKPNVLFVGHRQTMQTQIRHRMILSEFSLFAYRIFY